MMGERDYLMKRTFPKLRQFAAERDVFLTEVDLRWGITEEESKSGRVVDICLREIDNCTPFFIGIIGSRYGWIPSSEDLSANTFENFSSINSYLEKHLSVTEMEIQYGVLEREEDLHAVFYFKTDDTQSAIDEPEKLAALKKAIRENPRYPVSDYQDPEDLSIQVEQAFIRLLDSLFPKGQITPEEKRQIAQRSFMRSLCQSYVRNDEIFNALDDWLGCPTEQTLCILGKSGMGKSSLIANWINYISTKDTGYRIVCHFIGDGVGKESGESILPLISKKLNEEEKPVLMVLDGVDQLIDSDNSKQLRWLPSLPQGSKLLFSVTPGDWSTIAIKKKGAKELRLNLLDCQGRRDFLNRYLGLYGKKLPDDLAKRIISDERMQNLFVLKTFLDELIRFGLFHQLSDKIEWYLKGDSTRDFFVQVIKEYENEFDSENNKIVGSLLTLLAISFNGMCETDILTLSGLRRVELSQLYASLSPQLSVSAASGVICYSNKAFRDAVVHYYSLSGADCFDADADSGFRSHWWMSKQEDNLRNAIVSLCKAKLSSLGNPDGEIVREIASQYYVLYYEDELLDFLRPIAITGSLLSSKGGEEVLFRCWHWFIYECDLSFDEYIIDEEFSAEQVEDLMKLAEFALDFFDERTFALKVYDLCLELTGKTNAGLSQMIAERIRRINTYG